MEIHGGERFATTSSFPTDAAHHPQVDRQNFLHGGYPHHHHHHRDPRPHPNFNGEQNEPSGPNFNNNSNPPPLSGQKRQFHHTSSVDNGGFVKLYVVGIPRDATEQDVASVFGEYGEIIEIVLIKDKRTGIQQEYCFVKYATIDQAERAIGAFQSQYKFPGAAIPMKVKYADRERERERERIGSNAHLHKLYVGCVSKQALRWEIEEIFSPFGVLEDVFMVRDEFKQNRGFAFVQFSCRDMAVAAIQALNGTFVMRGCNQPLIVRFAEPKKPRVGDSRPAPYANDPSNGYVIPNETKQMKNTPPGCKTMLTACNGPATRSIAEMENSIECDWSEHVSPDAELYYYNCTTCESRWEKPVEYLIYEQELDYLEDKLQLQLESKLENLSSTEVPVVQKV